jgi:hypothetical protein
MPDGIMVLRHQTQQTFRVVHSPSKRGTTTLTNKVSRVLLVRPSYFREIGPGRLTIMKPAVT